MSTEIKECHCCFCVCAGLIGVFFVLRVWLMLFIFFYIIHVKILVKTHQYTPTQTRSTSISLNRIHVAHLLQMKKRNSQNTQKCTHALTMHTHTLARIECEDEG